jgi:16S rRNA (cytosine1402-N4)-methyltransferase
MRRCMPLSEREKKMSEEHKRRKRYSGKYPRKFEEKYKEQNPEKYPELIEHVIEKGSTPAGMHISICVQEILEVLSIQPGEKGCDCTLGYGGHSKAMLEKLQGKGHLCSLDVDPIESVKTEERMRSAGFGEDVWTLRHINFADIDQAAEADGPFNFVLADLGVSSMQIDDPKRGFSYKLDGPLDLRLNPEKGVSAAEHLAELEEYEIEGMLIENADEPYAAQIAEAIREAERRGRIETTTQLREIVESVVRAANPKASEKELKDLMKKSCQRTFQAIRIDINHEYEVLYSLLEKLPDVLASGGRVAILTFHSGEDRLVKKMFKEGKKAGFYKEVSKDVIKASPEECFRNPRARSAKLRYAIKA